MRRIVSVIGVCAVGVALTACGSTGTGTGTGSGGGVAGAGTVVSFGGRPIVTGALLAHWVRVEAVIELEVSPNRPPQAGVIPEPPAFTACIALRRAATHQPGASTVKLRGECQERYEFLVRKMLHLLIGYQWVAAEARALGIAFSRRELAATFHRNILELFGSEAAFHRYLAFSGKTVADELLVIVYDMQAGKIEEKITRERGPDGTVAYNHATARQLAAETSCSPGYVIADCKQYKGPQRPES